MTGEMLKRLNIGLFFIVSTALVLVAALFIFRELSVAGKLGFPLDDAWIHLNFARNFSRGLGFCFNPGEPVAGSTGPLWTALLGLLLSLFGASPGPVKVLGLLLLLGSALLARPRGEGIGRAVGSRGVGARRGGRLGDLLPRGAANPAQADLPAAVRLRRHAYLRWPLHYYPTRNRSLV